MVTAVVVVVAVGFGLSSLVRPFVPSAPSNGGLLLHGDFVARGANQPVQWRLARTEALDEARALNKPLLIVISRSGSPAGRQLDSLAFGDPEMAEQINRLFIPIRVDLEEEPGWDSLLLPFRRVELSPETGFELAVVHPDHGMAAWTLKYQVSARLDFSGLAAFLQQARKECDSLNPSLNAVHQKEWADSLSPSGEGDGVIWVAQAVRRAQLDRGLFAAPTRLESVPLVWSALIFGGEVETAALAMESILSTPMMEGVGGLLMSFSDSRDGRQPLGVMALNPNAEAVAAAARLHLLTGQDEWRDLASLMSRSIRAEFLGSRGAASTLTDPRGLGGARMALAVTTPQLWADLGPEDRRRAERVFGLGLGSSPRMTPYPTDWREWLREPRGPGTLHSRIRSLQSRSQLELGGIDAAVPTCLAAARLLEAGTLLDDQEIIEAGLAFFARAQLFRTGADDVVTERRSNGERLFHLASFLAYADACLWKHAAVGDEASLSDGLAVLKKGLARFEGPSGLSSLPRSVFPLWEPAAVPLGWVDGLRASDASMAIAMLGAYGAIYPETDLAVREQNLRFRLSQLLGRMSSHSGGLARSWLQTRGLKVASDRNELRSLSRQKGVWALLGSEANRPAPTQEKTESSVPQ
jgi:hypothetical protein